MSIDIAVSILIVTYNQQKYIASAIESLLCQETVYGYEILVGNDASTDATADILRSYAEKNPALVKVIFQKKNIGPTKNSYGLFKKARGRYIAFCDGDDCWDDKCRLQRQVDFLEQHPQYSAVCGKCRLIDEQGAPLAGEQGSEKQRFWQFSHDVFTWENFEHWQMPGHDSALLGRNLFRQNDATILYRAHPMVGDRTWILMFLLAGNIYCTDEIVSCYRVSQAAGHFMSEYKNKNLRYEDFYLMNSLEEYADEKGRHLDLENIKKERFIGAMCVCLKCPSLENYRVIQRIYQCSKNKFSYGWLMIRTAICKLYYWHVLHEDRPIRL